MNSEVARVHLNCLQFDVSAVTEGSIVGVFAVTQGNSLFLGKFKLHGSKTRIFVSPVAERLITGQTAATPVIGAGFQFHYRRLFGRDNRFVHSVLLWY
jgi:hypothetical protein